MSTNIEQTELVVLDENSEWRFRGSLCRACGALWFPLRRYCARCHSSALEFGLLPAVGELHSYTIVHVGRSGVPVPYAVGVATFGEEVSVFGRLGGWEDGVQIGQPVTAERAFEGGGDVRAQYRLALVPK
jgi:uncharacterized OB-fold protein